jgi:hypothetical protein
VADPAKIDKFKLELRLDATVEVNGKAWVKPGVTAGITWTDVPSESAVQSALTFLNGKIIEPTMSEVMDVVVANTKKAHGLE